MVKKKGLQKTLSLQQRSRTAANAKAESRQDKLKFKGKTEAAAPKQHPTAGEGECETSLHEEGTKSGVKSPTSRGLGWFSRHPVFAPNGLIAAVETAKLRSIDAHKRKVSQLPPEKLLEIENLKVYYQDLSRIHEQVRSHHILLSFKSYHAPDNATEEFCQFLRRCGSQGPGLGSESSRI
mmetsp:Transcript_11500/g.26273  ORF Transcript_11500/g.26273 Transcript_11500/m.26273 type:complete len:180 (-) Transcript_11500:1244-1783(-)